MGMAKKWGKHAIYNEFRQKQCVTISEFQIYLRKIQRELNQMHTRMTNKAKRMSQHNKIVYYEQLFFCTTTRTKHTKPILRKRKAHSYNKMSKQNKGT